LAVFLLVVIRREFASASISYGLFAGFGGFTTQFPYLRNRFFQIGHTEKYEGAWSGIISMKTSLDRRSLEPALWTSSHEMKIPAEQLPQESPSLAGVD
jgi:hypothetical protein